MGSSTVKLQTVVDNVAAQGVPNPLNNAGGYATQLALDMANDCAADIIDQRFNWKWNSKLAPAFLTNSFQQDYPQLGNTDIGWLEDADRIDINNTSIPKPIRQLTVRRALSRTSYTTGPINQIQWLFNSEMQFGEWPGPGIVYTPPIGTNPAVQNPLMSMVDANANLLILTGFGITGLVAPVLPAASAEGTTIADGTAIWTVVSPTSKGFRVSSLPGGTGPIWKVVPKYQMIAPRFTSLQQTLDPIPDDYERYFKTLYRIYCLQNSPNPEDRKQFAQERIDYLNALVGPRKQGDRESDAYAMYPENSVVESIYPNLRNPLDPSQPY
jgi:hypothetical protein